MFCHGLAQGFACECGKRKRKRQQVPGTRGTPSAEIAAFTLPWPPFPDSPPPLVALLLLAAGSRVAPALTINPIFDSTIVGDSNAATIEASINAAIRNYETLFSDPVTVSVTFKKVSTGLASSQSSVQNVSYASFLSHLNSDATTAADATALAHLPTQANNPVDGDANMTLTESNLRALNFFAPGNATATVYLNTSIMNLSRSGTVDSTKYDLVSAVSHELDEVLGTASALNGANGSATPTGPIIRWISSVTTRPANAVTTTLQRHWLTFPSTA